MSIAETLLPEFDHEMATTRKVLERVPGDKADWKPHQKSFALGALSLHTAEIGSWAVEALKNTELDVNPPGGSTYKRPAFESTEALLKTFDETAAKAREAIARASDAEFMVGWTLKNAGQPIFTMPRAAVVRFWVMNHIIHHRAQLVYTRATAEADA